MHDSIYKSLGVRCVTNCQYKNEEIGNTIICTLADQSSRLILPRYLLFLEYFLRSLINVTYRSFTFFRGPNQTQKREILASPDPMVGSESTATRLISSQQNVYKI